MTTSQQAFTSVFDNSRAVKDYVKIGWNIFPLRPGTKVPTGRGTKWQHFKAEDAQARFDRERKDCNIGLVLPADIFVDDVDPRNFLPGLDSWEEFIAANGGYGNLPETWNSTTGSGGNHYLWKLPGGMEPKKFSKDYPGIDIKIEVGYIVLPPSVTTGIYKWNLSPRDMDIATAPDFLIQKRGTGSFDPRQDSQFFSGTGTGKVRTGYKTLSRDELKELFTTIYIKGQRHGALIQLVGTFKGRDICGPCTLDFFYDWQENYFMPPFPVQQGNDEIKDTILSLYKNEDSKRFNKCRHQNEHHITWLKDWTLPIRVVARAAQKAHSEAHPKITDRDTSTTLAVVDMKEESIAVRARARSKRMFQASKDFTTDNEINAEGADNAPNGDSVIWNAEKNTYLSTYSAIGRQIGVSGTKAFFLMHNPEMAPHKDDLLRMHETHMVLGERDAERLDSCGFVINMVCKQHGNQGCTHASCKLGFHAACPTHMTYKLRQVTFPPLEEGEYYRETWFTGTVLSEGLDTGKIADNLDVALKKFQAVVAKANGWKDTRKLIIARSVSLRLERSASRVTYRVMVKEEYVGQANKTLSKIRKAVNAVVVAERRFQNPEDAAVQLMLNSMTSLNYLWNNNDTILFEAYRLALRGAKAFQTMGALWGLMKGTKKREAPLCPVCGGPLDMILVRPETSDNPSAHQTRPFQATGTDPPWR